MSEKITLSQIVETFSYSIFCLSEEFFIPGEKEDCSFKAEFDELSFDYFFGGSSFGKGWFFDNTKLSTITSMFDNQHVPYVIVEMKNIQLHNL